MCTDCPTGLDSFNLGLLVSGDWNEHVDNKAMKALEPRILEHPADYPAMQRLEKSTPLSSKARNHPIKCHPTEISSDSTGSAFLEA